MGVVISSGCQKKEKNQGDKDSVTIENELPDIKKNIIKKCLPKDYSGQELLVELPRSNDDRVKSVRIYRLDNNIGAGYDVEGYTHLLLGFGDKQVGYRLLEKGVRYGYEYEDFVGEFTVPMSKEDLVSIEIESIKFNMKKSKKITNNSNVKIIGLDKFKNKIIYISGLSSRGLYGGEVITEDVMSFHFVDKSGLLGIYEKVAGGVKALIIIPFKVTENGVATLDESKNTLSGETKAVDLRYYKKLDIGDGLYFYSDVHQKLPLSVIDIALFNQDTLAIPIEAKFYSIGIHSRKKIVWLEK